MHHPSWALKLDLIKKDAFCFVIQAELQSLNSNLQSQSLDLEKADEAIASAKAQADFAIDDKERELKETQEMYDHQVAALNEKLKDSESKLAHQMSLVKVATDAKVEALVQLSDAQVSSLLVISCNELFGIWSLYNKCAW